MEPVLLNLAFFPFKTQDGSPPKPGSPALSGSVQFTMEQLQELWQYAQTQSPDEYGKIRVNASLWDTVSKDGSKRFLKGNAKAPVPQHVQTMHQQVAATQQAAYQAAAQHAYPSWNNAQAYAAQTTQPSASPLQPATYPQQPMQPVQQPVNSPLPGTGPLPQTPSLQPLPPPMPANAPMQQPTPQPQPQHQPLRVNDDGIPF